MKQSPAPLSTRTFVVQRQKFIIMVGVLAAALAGLALHTAVSYSRQLSNLERYVLGNSIADAQAFSYNVSSCPGYTLVSVNHTETGLIGHLGLAGPACNAYGIDYSNLTLKVVYDSNTRLHVNIYDTNNSQFTIPQSVVALPADPTTSHKNSSDLVFNYVASPFAFWITRRSSPDDTPLFDTRVSSLPPTPVPPVVPGVNSSALDGFPLVFENQYLQLTSSLPYDTNIYGLGEVVASSGFRRDVGTNGGVGTIQTMWTRDVADPIDQNVYGDHPIYFEHRYNETTGKAQSHGVYLHSASGADILLLSPTNQSSLIEYRLIGGTLDFYFLSGPTPKTVIEQYSDLIGKPTWQPAWGFGFHLCRWGYPNISETRQQVINMRNAKIPLEVMWNDIDLYHAYRDFTTDPTSFPTKEVEAFMAELAANNQHYIPIVDAAIPVLTNKSDSYDAYTKGTDLDVFMKNPNGTQYVGQVWPGYTVFPDWFANNTQSWWTDAFKNWTTAFAVNFSGIWLDMNEVSSFCDGSCGTGANLSNTSTPFLLPGTPGNLITDYPEGYNSTISGPSGNITVNDTLTYGAGIPSTLAKRGVGAGNQTVVNLNAPPYAINNGNGPLSIHAAATNATHAGGYVELDVHNLWGLMEEKATHNALATLRPGKRPFLISRSTFPSSGKWTGHWLGDNFSKWQYLYFNIQGVLQFQIFQIPFVGADTCGFNGNTDEELCNRWMSLSAFVPFYRNHNVKGAISQEPYRWDSVAQSSRNAISARYSMLPYWYTLFADVSRYGTPPVRALFYEFPDEKELYSVDRQYMIGKNILVTPVLTPNVTTVDGLFPGRGRAVWRDWYTHEVVNYTAGVNTTLSAPLSHINVHVRDGAAMLLYTTPGYTIEETRQSSFSLLLHLTSNGTASDKAYMDDGESLPPTPYREVAFDVLKGKLEIGGVGKYIVKQKLSEITVLINGASNKSKVGSVSVGNEKWAKWSWDGQKGELVIKNLKIDLNSKSTVSWSL